MSSTLVFWEQWTTGFDLSGSTVEMLATEDDSGAVEDITSYADDVVSVQARSS